MQNIVHKTFLCSKMFGVIGFLLIGCSVVIFLLVLATGTMELLTTIPLFITLGYFFLAIKNKPVLIFEAEHFEYKAAPLADKQLFRYEYINNITIDEKMAIISFNNRKPLKLKLEYVRKEERDNFISTLNLLKCINNHEMV